MNKYKQTHSRHDFVQMHADSERGKRCALNLQFVYKQVHHFQARPLYLVESFPRTLSACLAHTSEPVRFWGRPRDLFGIVADVRTACRAHVAVSDTFAVVTASGRLSWQSHCIAEQILRDFRGMDQQLINNSVITFAANWTDKAWRFASGCVCIPYPYTPTVP